MLVLKNHLMAEMYLAEKVNQERYLVVLKTEMPCSLKPMEPYPITTRIEIPTVTQKSFAALSCRYASINSALNCITE